MQKKPIENLEFKLASLDEAISYPPYKEISASKIIELDEFNYDEIKKELINSVEYIDGEKLDLIDEIIKLLDTHQLKYHIKEHNYIGIYWRGLPMILIKTRSENVPQTMMYISVKTYKDELIKRDMTKLGSRIVYGAGIAIAATAGFFFSYKFLNNNNN